MPDDNEINQVVKLRDANANGVAPASLWDGAEKMPDDNEINQVVKPRDANANGVVPASLSDVAEKMADATDAPGTQFSDDEIPKRTETQKFIASFVLQYCQTPDKEQYIDDIRKVISAFTFITYYFEFENYSLLFLLHIRRQ